MSGTTENKTVNGEAVLRNQNTRLCIVLRVAVTVNVDMGDPRVVKGSCVRCCRYVSSILQATVFTETGTYHDDIAACPVDWFIQGRWNMCTRLPSSWHMPRVVILMRQRQHQGHILRTISSVR
jgi:hypothetical protein